MLRIAVVAPCPFPSARGSQVLMREVAEALAARGHEVHVIAYPTGEHLVPIQGIVVHRPPAFGLRFWGRLPWVLRKCLWDVLLVVTVCRVVRRSKIQVIHAHNYEGPLVALAARWMLGCPIVYHAHNVLSDELPTYFSSRVGRRLAGWIGRWADRLVPRLADAVVALSKAQEEALLGCGVRKERIVVLPPLVPQADEVLGKSRADIGSLSGKFVIGYAGNFDGYQEIALLTRGYSIFRERYPSATLLIVTHDEDWATRAPRELVALSGRGEAVVVVCRTFAETRPWLRRADVLVCPRSSWSGFPIKLLNFLVMDKPVVLSSGVARGIGWRDRATTFEAGREVALANLLLRLVSDSSAMLAAVEAVREFVAQLPSRRRIADELERVLEGVVFPPQGSLAWQRGGRLDTDEDHLGVDTRVVASYKPTDASREGEARA
ncbi:MAG: hypothetical protein KatS3mg077_1041 [Candidatus Binatia bacterium]|nr:MAG: hypothetical protein KatS3mg077_1041 [Candidatus Binatia bacterium]